MAMPISIEPVDNDSKHLYSASADIVCVVTDGPELMTPLLGMVLDEVRIAEALGSATISSIARTVTIKVVRGIVFREAIPIFNVIPTLDVNNNSASRIRSKNAD